MSRKIRRVLVFDTACYKMSPLSATERLRRASPAGLYDIPTFIFAKIHRHKTNNRKDMILARAIIAQSGGANGVR